MPLSPSFPLAHARWQRERDAHEVRRQALLARVEAVAREVLRPEAVEAAYVVGSLTEPGAHGPASDVDLAVLGLPPARYLAVLGTLQERIGTERVDLIELERVPFRDALVHRGYRIL
jgi:predicted nucleotidyltransferase